MDTQYIIDSSAALDDITTNIEPYWNHVARLKISMPCNPTCLLEATTNLTDLDMDCENLIDMPETTLGSLTNLSKLTLQMKNLNASEKPLLPMPSLTSLSISSSINANFGMPLNIHLEALITTHLQHIDFYNTVTYNLDYSHLTQLQSFSWFCATSFPHGKLVLPTSLTKLKLSDFTMTKTHPIFTQIPALTNLQSLELNVDKDVIECIPGLRSLPNLANLQLTVPATSSMFSKLFGLLPGKPKGIDISIPDFLVCGNTTLTDLGLIWTDPNLATNLSTCPNLTRLHIPWREGYELAFDCRALTHLTFTHVDKPDSVYCALKCATQSPLLTYLMLEGYAELNKETRDVLWKSLLPLTRLTFLELPTEKVSLDGAAFFEFISQFQQLTTLQGWVHGVIGLNQSQFHAELARVLPNLVSVNRALLPNNHRRSRTLVSYLSRITYGGLKYQFYSSTNQFFSPS